jgi:hypothetical protein
MTNPMPQPNNKPSWKCLNLDCLAEGKMGDACHNCGNPRGYMSPEIKAALRTQLEKLETQLPLKSFKSSTGYPNAAKLDAYADGRNRYRSEVIEVIQQAYKELEEA